MIYILSWTTKKHQKILSRPVHSKLKKIQGLFKDLHRNLRTFQGKMSAKYGSEAPCCGGGLSDTCLLIAHSIFKILTTPKSNIFCSFHKILHISFPLFYTI